MLFDFPLKAALPDEKALFYSGTSEVLPRIGYIRADFGSSGEEFWHSWYPGEATAFNTPEFRAELHVLIECLRTDLLSSREGMRQYLREHPGLLLEDSYLKVIATGCRPKSMSTISAAHLPAAIMIATSIAMQIMMVAVYERRKHP